jgi:hypothetical protein
MFGSHTLISYPIAIRFGIAKNRAVTTAVGGTIITDTAALLVLAVVARRRAARWTPRSGSASSHAVGLRGCWSGSVCRASAAGSSATSGPAPWPSTSSC